MIKLYSILIISLITTFCYSQNNSDYGVIIAKVEFKPKRTYKQTKANIKLINEYECFLFMDGNLRLKLYPFIHTDDTLELKKLILSNKSDTLLATPCFVLKENNLEDINYIKYNYNADNLLVSFFSSFDPFSCVPYDTNYVAKIKYDDEGKMIKDFRLEYFYDSLNRLDFVKMTCDNNFDNWICYHTYDSMKVVKSFKSYHCDDTLDYEKRIVEHYDNKKLISYEEYYLDRRYTNELFKFLYTEEGYIIETQIFVREAKKEKYKYRASYYFDIEKYGHITEEAVESFNQKIIGSITLQMY